jgi:hypothetical protein
MNTKRSLLNWRIPLRFGMRWIRRLLPTPGNVLFTLLAIATLLYAGNVSASSYRAPAAATSDSTSTIAYQGRLADTSGNPLTNTYPMVFRLYDVETGGVPLWEEQWTGSNSVRVSDGLFNVMLGSLTPIPVSLVTSHTSLYLGVTVGSDSEMTPRVQLGSVPFAMQALTVPDGSMTTPKLADGAVTSAKIADGTVSAADLANGAVTSAKIADGNVTTADLANSSVTQAKLGADVSLVPSDGSITTAKLADGSVTSAKIADSSVTTADLADGAVTQAKAPFMISYIGAWQPKLQVFSVCSYSSSTDENGFYYTDVNLGQPFSNPGYDVFVSQYWNASAMTGRFIMEDPRYKTASRFRLLSSAPGWCVNVFALQYAGG